MSNNPIIEINTAARTNPFLWVLSNLNLPKGMSWAFGKRKWQIPIIKDTSKHIVVRKPAQVGMSTIFLVKLLYLVYHIPMRAAYVLPREKDYQDMVKTRVNPIINSSDVIKEAMRDNDSVSIKQIDESFIHFLASNTEPRMLDIDCLILDEVDLSDPQYLDSYSARLYASPYKFKYSLSTPTVPDKYIDAMLQNSTWNVWNVRCPFCSSWIPFDDNWMGLLKEGKHRIYYGADCCDMCKDVGLTSEHISDGIWVPSYPERNVSGYSVIRTMDATTSAAELHQMWKTTQFESNFYNTGLGLPYSAENIVLDKDSILQRCIDSDVSEETVGDRRSKYHIGIDQGNVLHLVVLKESDDNKLELVYAEELTVARGNPFQQARKTISRFRNSSVLIDGNPNTHDARELAADSRNGKIANFQFSIVTKDDFFTTSKTNPDMIIIQKHEALDELINNYIRSGKLRFYSDSGGVDKTIDTVATHIATLRRTTKTRKMMGLGEREFTVWESINGNDHFALALLYAMISYLNDKKASSRKLRWRVVG